LPGKSKGDKEINQGTEVEMESVTDRVTLGARTIGGTSEDTAALATTADTAAPATTDAGLWL
jgi:hypothetical protein|tara:strand:- start:3688 stop:3873 length:186 start_codon:yes stop_codon:yes gene_type:complete